MTSRTRTLDQLTSEIQQTLALLAEVEARHGKEIEMVSRSAGPASWKDRVRCGLEARRRRDREPLARRLADLQREVTASAWLERLSERERGAAASVALTTV